MNGVRPFCGYQCFCYEIFVYLVSWYSPFLSNLLNQNLQNVKIPKRKLESSRLWYCVQVDTITEPWYCVQVYFERSICTLNHYIVYRCILKGQYVHWTMILCTGVFWKVNMYTKPWFCVQVYSVGEESMSIGWLSTFFQTMKR